MGERVNLLRSVPVSVNGGSITGLLPNHDGLLGVEPGKVPRAPHYAPLQGLMTSRYPGGMAVLPLTGRMGIAPIVGQTVTLAPLGSLRRSYSLA